MFTLSLQTSAVARLKEHMLTGDVNNTGRSDSQHLRLKAWQPTGMALRSRNGVELCPATSAFSSKVFSALYLAL